MDEKSNKEKYMHFKRKLHKICIYTYQKFSLLILKLSEKVVLNISLSLLICET